MRFSSRLRRNGRRIVYTLFFLAIEKKYRMIHPMHSLYLLKKNVRMFFFETNNQRMKLCAREIAILSSIKEKFAKG